MNGMIAFQLRYEKRECYGNSTVSILKSVVFRPIICESKLLIRSTITGYSFR